jgi:hypothetical protein
MPSGERCASVHVQRRRAVARSLTASAVAQVYARHAYRSISARVTEFPEAHGAILLRRHAKAYGCAVHRQGRGFTGRHSPRGANDGCGVVASKVVSTVRLCTVKVQRSTSANVADLRIVHDFIFCIGCDLVAGSVSPLLSRPPSANVSRIWLRGRHCLLEALEVHCT